MTGADQFTLNATRCVRNNGCGLGGENEIVLVQCTPFEKQVFFSLGEVFFLLTNTFNG